MPKPYREFEVGTTVQFTWVGSTAPQSLTLGIKTSSETVVTSVTMTQSTGGNWYRFVTIPDSFGKYPAILMAEFTATASTQAGSASQFISRLLFRVVKTGAFGTG